MTKTQLGTLAFFRDGERFLDGTPIDWTPIHYETMQSLELLRRDLDAPISLIRGAHPGETDNKRTAVDACAPKVRLERVFMGLTRLPRVSFGLYSGNSFHIDLRAQPKPARWMAVRELERMYLYDRDLHELVASKADGWLYLTWNHARSFEALNLVFELAARKSASGSVAV